MVVLELASSTGSSRGRSSKTTKKVRCLKAREAQNGGFGTGQQHGQQQGQEFQNQIAKNRFLKAREAPNGGFWNWPAARAAAGAGVPKPPKNRFLKAREAQNGGFGTGQQHGQQGQEFQNHQKIAF